MRASLVLGAISVMAAACGRFGFDAAPGPDAADAPAARRPLRFDRRDQGENLVDVPVMILLDATRVD